LKILLQYKYLAPLLPIAVALARKLKQAKEKTLTKVWAQPNHVMLKGFKKDGDVKVVVTYTPQRFAGMMKVALGLTYRSTEVAPAPIGVTTTPTYATYYGGFDQETLYATSWYHLTGTGDILDLSWQGATISDVYTAPGPGAPALQALSDFLAYQGPSFVQDTYSGTYKNYSNPALNTPPRAVGSHSYGLNSNTTAWAYIVTYALNKTVYGVNGSALGTGLSPSLVEQLVSAAPSITTGALDGDMLAKVYDGFRSGDLLTIYRLTVSYTAYGATATATYLTSKPTEVSSPTVVAKHTYEFVEGDNGGYFKTLTTAGMSTALSTVVAQDGVTDVSADALFVTSVFYPYAAVFTPVFERAPNTARDALLDSILSPYVNTRNHAAASLGYVDRLIGAILQSQE
jgi:hypothetical protein